MMSIEKAREALVFVRDLKHRSAFRAVIDEAEALRAERDRLRYGLLNLRAGVYRICDQRGYRDFDADVFPEIFEANAILAQENDHE